VNDARLALRNFIRQMTAQQANYKRLKQLKQQTKRKNKQTKRLQVDKTIRSYNYQLFTSQNDV